MNVRTKMICTVYFDNPLIITDLFDWQGGFFESVKENHSIDMKYNTILCNYRIWIAYLNVCTQVANVNVNKGFDVVLTSSLSFDLAIIIISLVKYTV